MAEKVDESTPLGLETVVALYGGGMHLNRPLLLAKSMNGRT